MSHHEARADTCVDHVQEVLVHRHCLHKVDLNLLLLSRPKLTPNVLLTLVHQAERSSTKLHRLQLHSHPTASNGRLAAAEVEVMPSNHHHSNPPTSATTTTATSGNVNPSLNPPSSSLPTPRPPGSRNRPRAEPIDLSVVAITKNFARKAAPVLNDVNAHKLAGIFAKPLTERDAPGYRDLIYRPQDLKSIRAAVGRGSRAANALIDEMDTKAEEGGSGIGSPANKQHPTALGPVLVSKTDSLMPPKGIVNSAQLEMEFVRIFANAVMFNPLPPSERGRPPRLRMQKDGVATRNMSKKSKVEDEDGGEEEEEEDDEDHDDDRSGNGDGDKDVESESDAHLETHRGYAQEEEGSIIHDSREMFASVEKAVAQWRSVEQGYIDDVPRSSAAGNALGVGLGLGLGFGLGLRGGSASYSASDALAEESAQEDADGGDAGAGIRTGSANARKRRRLMS